MLGALLVGAAVGALIYDVSLEPGAAIVAAVFDASPLITPPPGFQEQQRRVAPVRRAAVPTTEAPAAHLDLYRPTGTPSGIRPVLLWIHGGGFISSSSSTVADYAVLLAASGAVVGSLDYTLAPGAHHPVPVRQAAAALLYLHRIAPDAPLFIAGDSAGAQIASETAAAETDPALAAELHVSTLPPGAAPKGVILFCGLYDLRTVGRTGFPALRTYLWAYLGQRDWQRAPDAEQLSTARQATSAFPPTFISVGDSDPFDGQGHEMARALRRRGVPVSTVFWDGTGDGLRHEYQFDLQLPQARTALRATEQFITERSQ